MKKRELWFGLGMIAGGILFLLAALLLETPLDSLFCGFFGAFTGPGVMQVYKYVKWTKLETADSCQQHFEEEQIELRDERKSMLRDRALCLCPGDAAGLRRHRGLLYSGEAGRSAGGGGGAADLFPGGVPAGRVYSRHPDLQAAGDAILRARGRPGRDGPNTSLFTET